MTKLNEYTNKTKRNIHILVTSLCNRDCKYCCNKQYNISEIPCVTDDELQQAENIFITGGEPFAYTQPNKIATYYKDRYNNIKKVIVYTNALELYEYLCEGGGLTNIDELSISIKTEADSCAMRRIVCHPEIKSTKSNRIYVFDSLYNDNLCGFEVYKRDWQKDFEPAADSIFRRM